MNMNLQQEFSTSDEQLKNGLKSPHDTETSLDTHASGPDKDDLYLDLINP